MRKVRLHMMAEMLAVGLQLASVGSRMGSCSQGSWEI
jgi:hypothetical protein